MTDKDFPQENAPQSIDDNQKWTQGEEVSTTPSKPVETKQEKVLCFCYLANKSLLIRFFILKCVFLSRN